MERFFPDHMSAFRIVHEHPSGVLAAMSFNEWLESLISASPTIALAIGIGLTVAGSGLMAVGSVVMKIGIHQESKRLQRDISVPLSSQLWWLGLTTYSLGAILHLIGLAFAPASILAPLNALGLVANAAAAVVFLEETLSYTEMICTLGAVLGVSLCALASFLPHDESCVVSGIESWTDPLYLIYVSLCGASLLLLLILINHAEAQAADAEWEAAFRRHLEAGHIELVELGNLSGTGLTNVSNNDHGDLNEELLHPLASRQRPDDRLFESKEVPQTMDVYPGHIGVFYSIVAGIVGAQCVLQLKECSAFLKLAVEYPHIWWQVQPYLATLFGIVAIVLQMHFLNLALARGDATLVIPCYYVFWTIFGTIGGFVKFHEIFGFSLFQMILFALGLLFTLVSIALMASLDIERVQYTVERTATLGPRGYQERLLEAPLNLGVPLAVGLGIIPVGKLAGRLRTIPSHAKHFIRRTQSLTEFPAGAESLTDEFRRPKGVSPIRHRPWDAASQLAVSTPVPYTWTVTGVPSSRTPGNRDSGRLSADQQTLRQQRGSASRSSGPAEQQRERTGKDEQSTHRLPGQKEMPYSQTPPASPSNNDWYTQRGRPKYKKLSDIVFEENPVHGRSPPTGVAFQEIS